jgi:hypothetical protein
MNSKFLGTIIWLAITACFFRGLLIFGDQRSQNHMFPTATAICLVGAILAAVLMYKKDQN